HWNDPDYLQIGIPGISELEAQSQFSLWAIMASPLIIGADPRSLAPFQIEVLTNPEAVAINQDPLGVEAIKVSERSQGLQVWSKVLNLSGQRAVAFFNRSASASNMTVTANEVGLRGSFAVRDVWAHVDRGTYPSYTVSVPSHGVALLKLTEGTENNLTAYAVNAGGPAYAPFIADTTVDGGIGWFPDAISTVDAQEPAPIAVYQSARAGLNGEALQYYVPNLEVGAAYRVRLHFSENWQDGIGLRKFDVRINGIQV